MQNWAICASFTAVVWNFLLLLFCSTLFTCAKICNFHATFIVTLCRRLGRCQWLSLILDWLVLSGTDRRHPIITWLQAFGHLQLVQGHQRAPDKSHLHRKNGNYITKYFIQSHVLLRVESTFVTTWVLHRLNYQLLFREMSQRSLPKSRLDKAGRVRWAIVNLRQSETRLHKSVRHKLHFLVATVFFDPACSSFTMLSN